jgi:hypothetical protein
MLGHELKIQRAAAHLAALTAVVNDWLATDAYTIIRELDPDSGDTVCRAKVTGTPPDELSLLIGDVAHNLRSALDHAVYFVAKRHLGAALTPEIESSLMFPIVGHETIKGDPADGPALFQNQINSGRLRGLPQDALNFVESEQPFRWGQDGYQYHQL